MHEDSALILPVTLLKQCQKVRMCKKLLQLMENVVTRQSVQKQTQDLESNIASNSILKKIKIKNPQIKGDNFKITFFNHNVEEGPISKNGVILLSC